MGLEAHLKVGKLVLLDAGQDGTQLDCESTVWRVWWGQSVDIKYSSGTCGRGNGAGVIRMCGLTLSCKRKSKKKAEHRL